jgi:hypothetical protein
MALGTIMGGGGLFDGIAHVINAIRGKSPEDAAKLSELTMKYQTDILAADVQMSQMQADVNKAEAASGDKFTSRWRPTIGYILGAALAINFVVGPIATWIARMYGKTAEFPQLDMVTMMPVLLGMLGLGGYRAWEKVNKSA